MRLKPWGTLGAFWAGIILLASAGGATLQVLGPPAVAVHTAKPAQAPHGTPAATHDEPPHGEDAGANTAAGGRGTAPSAAATNATPASPGHAEEHAATPSPALPVPHANDAFRIAAPDPALQERSAAFPGAQLPRVAPDGRTPRVVYAAPFVPPPPGKPRVALLVGSIGQSEKDSRDAVEKLPGSVSLAISAYAGAPAGLYDAARAAGHELLASIPMEPQGFPLNDAGARSLLTGLTPEDNRLNLEWALGRTPGVVGATSASDGMRGERFEEVGGAFGPVLDEIARRGLLFIDARLGRSLQRPGLATRGVDVVVDESPARAEIEGKLASLERIAREKGSAIGLAGAPRPVTIERLAAWTQGLAARGLVLVPVSALVAPP